MGGFPFHRENPFTIAQFTRPEGDGRELLVLRDGDNGTTGSTDFMRCVANIAGVPTLMGNIGTDGVLHFTGVQITGASSGMLRADASGNVSSISPNIYQAHPADPIGATGAPPVMMGLAGSITPVGTAVRVTLSGNLTSGAVVGQVELRNGTGTAPTNGAAPVGTSPIVPIYGIANTTVPFSTQYALTGQTPGVALWFDAKLVGGIASTTTITNLSITLEEIR
jgi:hypothetical protein